MKKTVGILMADLSGYTAMTEIHGDNAAVEVVEKYRDGSKLPCRSKLLVGKNRRPAFDCK
jgi:class 3 adenylate cyclase